MSDVLELHEFFVEGGDRDKSHVLLHITEPSGQKDLDKGYFFVLAEIENGHIEQIKELQQLIDDLESGYYETEDDQEKSAFELTLEYINRRSHKLLEYENSNLNCLVGVLQGKHLSFAYHGQPNINLYFKHGNSTETINYYY